MVAANFSAAPSLFNTFARIALELCSYIFIMYI